MPGGGLRPRVALQAPQPLAGAGQLAHVQCLVAQAVAVLEQQQLGLVDRRGGNDLRELVGAAGREGDHPPVVEQAGRVDLAAGRGGTRHSDTAMNRNGTILVIDDEPGIRTVLTDILEDESHTVYAAADGFEGLAIMKQEPFEVVILDVWLPNMGGMDVLKELKNEYPEVEVIIISGHGTIETAVKATRMGAFDFIEKPLSIEKTLLTLKHAVEEIKLSFQNRRLREELARAAADRDEVRVQVPAGMHDGGAAQAAAAKAPAGPTTDDEV